MKRRSYLKESALPKTHWTSDELADWLIVGTPLSLKNWRFEDRLLYSTCLSLFLNSDRKSRWHIMNETWSEDVECRLFAGNRIRSVSFSMSPFLSADLCHVHSNCIAVNRWIGKFLLAKNLIISNVDTQTKRRTWNSTWYNSIWATFDWADTTERSGNARTLNTQMIWFEYSQLMPSC